MTTVEVKVMDENLVSLEELEQEVYTVVRAVAMAHQLDAEDADVWYDELKSKVARALSDAVESFNE